MINPSVVDEIKVVPFDAVYDKIECNGTVARHISDTFRYQIEGAKFHPKVKAGMWDGYVKFFNLKTRFMYVGLRQKLEEFAHEHGYRFTCPTPPPMAIVTEEEALAFIETLNLPKELNGIPFEVRDYQIESFLQAINSERLTIMSPTGSGKSLITYLISRYYEGKILTIVPRVGLVDQLANDYAEYGYKGTVNKIYGGGEKTANFKINVSTWQSLKNLGADFINQFEVIIADECWQFAANKPKEIMESANQVRYRFGLTGTLPNDKIKDTTIEGLFGRVYQVVTTKELMEEDSLADLNIHAITLRHTDENCKKLVKAPYDTEVEYICQSESRNKFIRSLALSLKGNTIILVRYIDKHALLLKQMIEDKLPEGLPFYYVGGDTEKEDRERIRKSINQSENSLTLATVGTFAVGTNIPRLHNIIAASPSKSSITVLQSIGRVLRRSSDKSEAAWYDIGDDLSQGKWENHTLRHYRKRKEIYKNQKFSFKQIEVRLRA